MRVHAAWRANKASVGDWFELILFLLAACMSHVFIYLFIYFYSSVRQHSTTSLNHGACRINCIYLNNTSIKGCKLYLVVYTDNSIFDTL